MPDVTWWYPPDEEIREELDMRIRHYERFFHGKYDVVFKDPTAEEMEALGIEGDSENKRTEPAGLNVAETVTERWYAYDNGDQTDGT